MSPGRCDTLILGAAGIAIENGPKVCEFAATLRIPYPLLFTEADGLELMRGLGNASGGLPYTVFLGRKGEVAHRKLGALKRVELDSILASLAKT